jgi:CheY-like chemotaxis protein
VVEAALEAVRPAAFAKHIELTADLDRHCGRVWADPSRLQQVMWNLLTNATKFTPAHGEISVRLHCEQGQVVVCVRDTGIGIAADFLPHVFERFRQAESNEARTHGGLGLGLAIVRHLVEAHGGVIRAESAGVSRGSTFTILLPVPALVMETPDEGAATTAKRPAALDRFLLAGLRVLIVEDDADSRDILATVLRESGAEVSAAESAMEALAAIEDRPPDAVVSDIGMPEMDGYAFVAELRRRPPDKGGLVPAIALTAYTEPQSRNRAIAAGFQEHLSKPAEPHALLAAVARLTNRRPAS